MTGIDIRLEQLFDADSGRSFIVAFDHGQSLPIPLGLGNPVDLIKSIADGKPEGVLLNAGMLSQASDVFAKRGAPTPIVRVDWTTLDPQMKEELGEQYRMQISPTDALTLGAGAICVYLIGRPAQGAMFADNIAQVAAVIQDAHRIGLPVIVEATLWGTRNQDQKDPQLLRQICRIAAEIGADAIKTEYVGNQKDQRSIIEDVGNIPVLTLGGAAGSSAEVEVAAKGAITSGARGIIFGRNVWQVPDMTSKMRTLSVIVHQ